jgi:hypothetical protein
MITDTVSAIKREVLQLIDLQIETLKQKSSLDFFQLNDYQARSERIRKLYEELDRIGLTQRLPGGGHPPGGTQTVSMVPDSINQRNEQNGS